MFTMNYNFYSSYFTLLQKLRIGRFIYVDDWKDS